MLRFGFWLPVFGGWLRNVDDEHMAATWEYQRDLVRWAETAGWDVTLIAELNLNDIKGPEADCLEAWTTAAALAAVTDRVEIMTAVRPNFRLPAIVAKEAATIDRISNGRFTLNVVSAWWESESKAYGGFWVEHDERYARTEEFLHVMKGMWAAPSRYTFKGHYYNVENANLAPKPVQKPWPTLYAGGESPRGKETIAFHCDAYLMHGDSVDVVAGKIADMRERREKAAEVVRGNRELIAAGRRKFLEERGLPGDPKVDLPPELKPLGFGVAGYAIVRDTEAEAKREVERITDVKASARGYASYQDFVKGSKLETTISLEDYSVSNRGLRTGLVGTPEQVAEQLRAFAAIGVDLVLLQCSPQREEMERFAAQVFPLVRDVIAV